MIYIDADAFARWEKGVFDLPAWLEARDDIGAFPALVWQQIVFGVFAWEPARAAKRARSLLLIGGMPVMPFGRAHASRVAELAAEMNLNTIGAADTQIASPASAWHRYKQLFQSYLPPPIVR